MKFDIHIYSKNLITNRILGPYNYPCYKLAGFLLYQWLNNRERLNIGPANLPWGFIIIRALYLRGSTVFLSCYYIQCDFKKNIKKNQI